MCLEPDSLSSALACHTITHCAHILTLTHVHTLTYLHTVTWMLAYSLKCTLTAISRQAQFSLQSSCSVQGWLSKMSMEGLGGGLQGL